MADEFENEHEMPEELEGAEIPEQEVPEYEDLVEELPEREIDLGDYKSPKTLTEEEEGTVQRSDIQAILKALTPVYPDKKLNEKLQPVMVSRVFPDNLLDSCKMTVLSRLQDYEPDDTGIDIWGVILATHNAHSIGFEGRGIGDRLEIAGAIHEEEIEKLSKEFGLG